jgi:hypothetical protein
MRSPSAGRQGKKPDQAGHGQPGADGQLAGVVVDEAAPGEKQTGNPLRIAPAVSENQRKAGDDIAEQKERDQGPDRHQQDRIDGGTDDLLLELGQFFVEDEVALQRFGHVAGALAGPHRRHVKFGKGFRMALQGSR